jgi:hypothetical protein
MANVKMMKAIVAPRRTVMLGNNKYAGPGEEVSLPADEVTELRASGFLVDPTAAEVPVVTDGPSIGNDDPSAPTVTAG